VEGVVIMVFVIPIMDNAHVTLDGQTLNKLLNKVSNALNKSQENVQVIVMEMVNVKQIILALVIQDIT